MQRYKEYVQKMIDENKKAFDAFQLLHDAYALKPDGLQEKYNIEGEKILRIVREYENRVCANQGRGIYNKFSHNLADKFHAEVLRVFPMIDHIGLKIEKPKNENGSKGKMAIPKINLQNAYNQTRDNKNAFALKRIKL